MNGSYYASLLERLRASIVKRHRRKFGRGVLLQQDNAPVHSSKVAMATVRRCGFEILPHPPYSPDLVPSYYHLLGNLKKNLRGRRFHSDPELKAAVEGWFEEQNSEFYEKGITALEKRWEKCIRIQGDYVEK